MAWPHRYCLVAPFLSELIFEQLNELLALGTLTVLLENSEGEEILARHGNDGACWLSLPRPI